MVLEGSYKLEVAKSDIARWILAGPILQGVDTGILHERKVTNYKRNASNVVKWKSDNEADIRASASFFMGTASSRGRILRPVVYFPVFLNSISTGSSTYAEVKNA
jgi:hypothetical protein